MKEHLAQIKAKLVAMLASAFYMVGLQDEFDKNAGKNEDKKQQYLLRTLANLNKYFTAKHAVNNIHHCIDILAGNGTIESFSALPRLLRDCIVCENWEGTHFTLWMQTLRDILRFKVDEIFLDHLLGQLKKSKKMSIKNCLANKSWLSKRILPFLNPFPVNCKHCIFAKSLKRCLPCLPQ